MPLSSSSVDRLIPRPSMFAYGTNLLKRTGRTCPLCPMTSDLNLFCYCKGVVHLVGSYLRYIGRGANAFGKAARDPQRTLRTFVSEANTSAGVASAKARTGWP